MVFTIFWWNRYQKRLQNHKNLCIWSLDCENFSAMHCRPIILGICLIKLLISCCIPWISLFSRDTAIKTIPKWSNPINFTPWLRGNMCYVLWNYNFGDIPNQTPYIPLYPFQIWDIALGTGLRRKKGHIFLITVWRNLLKSDNNSQNNEILILRLVYSERLIIQSTRLWVPTIQQNQYVQ